MLKKLFTLVAFLAVVMGAKAEWVEDYKIDYSTYQGFPFYVMGYVPEWIDGVMTDFGASYKYTKTDELKEDESPSDVIVKTQSGVEYYRYTEGGGWHQYFIADGIETEIDGSYTVTAMVRASEACNINVNMGWGWGDGQSKGTSVAIGTEWAEVEWEYTGIGGTSCNLVAQPGGFTGTIEWQWVKVGHNAKAQKPITWIQLLENGDAEKDWSEIVPNGAETADDADDNYKVCAWGKEYKGRDASDLDGDGNPKEIAHPHPATIEEIDGNRVFVVHAVKVDIDEHPGFFYNEKGEVEGHPQWQNQFWIESPKEWKGGEQVRISFKYKASKTTGAVNTQCHAATPGSYLHWAAIGDINFTEEWQEFNKVVTLPDSGKGMFSVAFNLGSNDNWKEDIDFYFDDLSWEEMKLDHGYFVAGCNTQTGLEYDLDNAIEFVPYEDEEGVYIATIGEKGNENTYVDQVMVSTVRGNDAAFKAATLKTDEAIVSDEDAWNHYEEKAVAKLTLPGEGVWQIILDEGYASMNFIMIEGKVKEKLEFVPNPVELVVNALERDDLKDDDHPEGTGLTWDNQLWICANRELSKGETTYLEFEYMAANDANTSTQCHGEPGAYKHWDAIGNVEFTTEWKKFEREFTVSEAADGMRTIAFNLSEIKEANEYHIKNVIWRTADEYESLIAMKDSDQHFAWKVLGGSIVVGLGAPKADGDVNGDGIVNITDLNIIIDAMSGEAVEGNTDVNGDGIVNITDLNQVIDIMSGEE